MADIERQLSERARTTALTALEVVPFAMLIADSSAQALAVNSRWMELSGLGRPNSLGPGWLSVLEPEARSRLRETVIRVAGEGGTGTTDLQIGSGGHSRWVRWWVSRHEIDGTALMAVAAADINEDYTREANLYHLATHDSLTGLVNRSHFMECTDQALRRSARQQRHVAVVYVDLDDFKRVNDRGGHSLGDRVLYAIAARLRHAVRDADMVARIGGDEFAVLCEDLTASEQADIVARRIASALTESVELDGQRWPVAASVGAAVDRGEMEPAEALVDRADQAMYTIKLTRRPVSSGPARYRVSEAGESSEVGEESATPVSAAGAAGGAGGAGGAGYPADSGLERRESVESRAGGVGWSGPAPRAEAQPATTADPGGASTTPAESANPASSPAPASPPSAAERRAPGPATAARLPVLDDDEARRALRELVEDRVAREPAPAPAAGRAPGRQATATAAPVAPPAPSPSMVSTSEMTRERLATDVMTLRDSIDSIRRMLDRLLAEDLAKSGVIDIRDRPET